MKIDVCSHCMEMKNLKPVIVYIDDEKSEVDMCDGCRKAFKKLCSVYHIDEFRKQTRRTLKLVREARA